MPVLLSKYFTGCSILMDAIKYCIFNSYKSLKVQVIYLWHFQNHCNRFDIRWFWKSQQKLPTTVEHLIPTACLLDILPTYSSELSLNNKSICMGFVPYPIFVPSIYSSRWSTSLILSWFWSLAVNHEYKCVSM